MTDQNSDQIIDLLRDQNTELEKSAVKTVANTSGAAPKEVSKKSLFGNLNSDLKSALDTWEVLTEQMAQKISPEEEQLREVKRILGELKAKLKEFAE